MSETVKTPTIQDVARHASVSTATVSRALSNPERVSEEMREKVSLAVEATGYTLNQAARSLRMRNTKTILVALPNVSNPFFSPILGAIEKEATAQGYSVLVANCTPDEESKQRLRDYLRSNRADGLLLFDGSIPLQHLEGLFQDPKHPPIVVACEVIPNSPYSTVKTNNVEAAEQATQYLIDIGHTRIAHVAGPADNILGEERERGFRQAMAGARLKVWPDYVIEGGFTIDGGVRAARLLMSQDAPPTAVFCASDVTAIGFLSQAQEMGFRCPKEISVVGFDDIELAAHFSPPLTTVHQPTEDLGRLAAEALLDMLERNAARRSPARVMLHSELVIRGSAAPPRRSEQTVAANLRGIT
ncbi:LacI family DNA-binding transcriptional regulator [Mariluticola halotolerans]|uniref:LacI family DNA-binding transcriptional regulator n=1 Tax=Mariluticola halotolerans TaxID=2909283 RepID=UPI0026E208C6|nr:LacI family DNA-binding transcriptional regulator [Mariluticola halotolerans]UJQ95587.1 LacI family transcriptional regulator [Mariluticola halotolerans]